MAGTTANYGFTYPTSTDLVKDGATAIQTAMTSVDTWLVGSGIGSTGKAFNAASVQNSADQTTTSTSFVEKTAHTASLTVGKSGLVLVIATIQGYPSTSTEAVYAGIKVLDGAATAFTSDNQRSVRLVGNATDPGVGTLVRVFDLTAGNTVTVNLVMRSTVGTSTAHVLESNFQIVTLA